MSNLSEVYSLLWKWKQKCQ